MKYPTGHLCVFSLHEHEPLYYTTEVLHNCYVSNIYIASSKASKQFHLYLFTR